MSEIQEIFVGDEGTEIEVDVGIPSSEILECKLLVRKPDGSKIEWIAYPKPDTTYIYYITQTGDLDKEGTWHIQAWVKTSSWQGYGSITSFIVKKPL